MPRWLLDASVALAGEDPEDPNHLAAVALLEGSDASATLDLALYEVANVAVTAWSDPGAARRLVAQVEAFTLDGGVVRCEQLLLSRAIEVATDHGISIYDAAYVAAAEKLEARLVSCDVRDLVSRGLAVTPRVATGHES